MTPPMDNLETTVATPLGSLHVEVAGSGEALVLWPSLLMDADLWRAQVERFAPNYRTVSIDPPGHGRSRSLTREFTFDECARCVVTILDALGIRRAHFVGNSWGAMIGGTLAATYPDRVHTVILMNGTASRASLLQRIEYSALITVARLLGGIRPPLTRSVVRAFLGPTSRATRPDVVRQVLDTATRNEVTSVAFAVRSVVIHRPDQRRLFGAITCPALVVAGREDSTFPLAELQTMARAIPTAELVVIDDAAHLAAAEVPEIVNDLIEQFLTRHRSTEP
ncbi:alpha/beta hydrolase [Nocardia sp. CA2R105]|uniref:alpha/beta fold hydrolase n=1 Tax=Nocardia coffeae TaxID=2873381 RepID=UPI001CA6288C|nr:alpha/beta hydrolase [Nocardia coffeae]MBY8856150.1 alpha/beta hydrolase [Nocardia coffeae]